MINTINIEIQYFNIKKFPRYNILSNEISRYFQNIEILPSTTPEKPSSKGYDALVGALQAHLDPKPIVITERFKFHRRNQRKGKSVTWYIVELRKLTTHCEFRDYLDQAIRDRLVCGLNSEAIQKRLLSERDLTLEAA